MNRCPGYQHELDSSARLYPVSGGLPIVVNNKMIGVVGAGGYRPKPPVWSDEIWHTGSSK